MCGLEFPDIEQLIWKPHRADGVVVIGINTGGLYGDDNRTRIERFIAETGITFPVAQDLAGSAGQFGGGPAISPFPIDVVVGRDGRIVYVSREYDASAMIGAVQAAL